MKTLEAIVATLGWIHDVRLSLRMAENRSGFSAYGQAPDIPLVCYHRYAKPDPESVKAAIRAVLDDIREEREARRWSVCDV